MNKPLIIVLIIIVWSLFFVTSTILLKKAGIRSRKQSYSTLGNDMKYGYLFNLLLIGNGAFHVSFFVTLMPLILTSMQTIGQLGVLGLLVTTIAGIHTGLFPMKHYPLIHRVFAWIGFSAAAVGWIFLSIELYQVHRQFGIGMLIFGLILIPTMIPIYRRNNNDLPATYESVFFVGAFITDFLLIAVI